MKSENFYAKVEKVKTSELSPGFLTNSYNEYSIVVTDNQNNKIIVSQCSENYCLIPNSEIFPSFEKHLKKEFNFKPKYKEYNNSQFYVEYVLDGKIFGIGEGDKLQPMLKVAHSYNKASSFKVSFGYYRLICTNGLFMFKSDREFSYKHFVGNQDEIFSKIEGAAKIFVSRSEKSIELFRLLNNRIIENPDQRIEEIIKGTGYLKRSQREIAERVAVEQAQLGLINDWIIYNAFNYQLNHNKEITSPEERKMRIDREVFDWIVKNQ